MAHTAPTAPLVLHHTRIGKGSMKKFRINYQWRSEIFSIIIFHLSIGKAVMNTLRLCKLCKDYLLALASTVNILSFKLLGREGWRLYKEKGETQFSLRKIRKSAFEKSAMIFHIRHLSWLPNWQLKTRRRSNTLKCSQRMGADKIR
jgi:hypothetical protein